MTDAVRTSSESTAAGGAGERVVLVTGAGKGLGAAFARACAQRGDCVVVNNRIRDGANDDAEAVAGDIRAAGGRAVAEHSDVSDPGAADAMIACAMNSFGRLDAVIANAGISGTAARLADVAANEFEDVLAVNFLANVRLSQAALPHLITSPAGRLVLITSTGGLYGVKGRAAYAASKGALTAFGLSLADETRRHGVGVNMYAPYAATRMTQATAGDPRIAAVLDPLHAAAPAAWLAGPACMRTGEFWLGGAGWLRRARIQESEGASMACAGAVDDAAIDACARLIDAQPADRAFDGGEAAFADLFARVRQHNLETVSEDDR